MASKVPVSAGDGLASVRQKYADVDKRRLFETGLYLLLLAALVGMMWTGRNLQWDDRAFSLVVGIPTIALLLVQIAIMVRPDLAERFGSDDDSESFQEKFSASIEGSEEEGRPAHVRRKYEILLILWTIAFPIAMYYFGMLLIVPVYVFLFVWFFHGSLKAALVTTVVFSVVTYLLFVWFLELRPWPGVLFE